MYVDIHTHRPSTEADVVSVVNAADFSAAHGFYSVGIHPWQTAETTDMTFIKSLAHNAFAIGECGLDKLRGAALDVQLDVFRQHVALANQLSKPIIVHCVKCYGLILTESADNEKYTPWIMHGCNASPEWIRSAQKHNIYFSLGPRQLNSAKAELLLKSIPAEKLFLETDDTEVCISEVYVIASRLMGVNLEELKQQIKRNFDSMTTLRQES
ncbi:MAG: TatD family hydrolase [Bacteroidales bacterium]|nr:TatD family hydrolase [Bacteroidales bacterium]